MLLPCHAMPCHGLLRFKVPCVDAWISGACSTPATQRDTPVSQVRLSAAGPGDISVLLVGGFTLQGYLTCRVWTSLYSSKKLKAFLTLSHCCPLIDNAASGSRRGHNSRIRQPAATERRRSFQLSFETDKHPSNDKRV
ncbi:hypothetical protein FALCPG4_014057 [Fusarium falciforme]